MCTGRIVFHEHIKCLVRVGVFLIIFFKWVTQISPSPSCRVMYCKDCVIWRQMEGGKLLFDHVVLHLLIFSLQEKKSVSI